METTCQSDLGQGHQTRTDNELDDLLVDVKFLRCGAMAHGGGLVCRTQELVEQLPQHIFFHRHRGQGIEEEQRRSRTQHAAR